MKRVAIGVLGTVLDKRGKRENRWNKWRPTVGMCQQPDFPIDRLELIYQPRDKIMAERTMQDILLASPHMEIRLHEIALRNPWDIEEVYTALLDFAERYPFDTENEEYLIHITTGTHVVQICWFLLTEARYFPAKLIQTMPERKSTKEEGEHANPAGSYSIIDLDLSRYDRISTRFKQLSANSVSYLKAGIATRNATFNRLIDEIERVAIRSTAPILMIGPTGAGKSFLARRIYELKQERHRLSGRFVEVNCATLRGDSAMSTLFGHVKGAFTGAQSDRPGLLRSANGGMLFLDEIGELGLDEQAMLLKAIEEKTFFPFGSDKEVHSDFQLIAGTHRDLRKQVSEGRFREDLYARINLWTYQLPGLADRPEDLEPNLDYELARFAKEQGERAYFNAESRRRYLSFATSSEASWSGNFRELSASVTRMATLAESGRITDEIVTQEIERLRYGWGLAQREESAALPDVNDPIDLFDYHQLKAVLEVCRTSASLSDAGRKLFAVSRSQKKNPNDADRLRKYLSRFGLSWEMLKR
ncbi:RNA repair transcriptional activator RtcR [Leminorella grimontii]|uniref:RNA repair transcriptional activator RtcR n=1 Tax=Leminorella grimontii TaxID=82981 RepID=UPI0020806667|nr:RNA repair transcriptional activator RtcR [Leminorella grimontii]GKX58378.1 transcriptional regulator [Leminorella grimontii]